MTHHVSMKTMALAVGIALSAGQATRIFAAQNPIAIQQEQLNAIKRELDRIQREANAIALARAQVDAAARAKALADAERQRADAAARAKALAEAERQKADAAARAKALADAERQKADTAAKALASKLVVDELVKRPLVNQATFEIAMLPTSKRALGSATSFEIALAAKAEQNAGIINALLVKPSEIAKPLKFAANAGLAGLSLAIDMAAVVGGDAAGRYADRMLVPGAVRVCGAVCGDVAHGAVQGGTEFLIKQADLLLSPSLPSALAKEMSISAGSLLAIPAAAWDLFLTQPWQLKEIERQRLEAEKRLAAERTRKP